MRSSILLMLAAILAAGAAPSETPGVPPAGSPVVGKVLSEAGSPIVGATVLLSGVPGLALTDADGIYVIPRVPPGEHVLSVHHRGRLLAESRLLVDPDRGSIRNLTVSVPPEPSSSAPGMPGELTVIRPETER